MKNAFKPIGIILMFVAALMTTSCSNDNNRANTVVGTWTCTANSATNPHSDWPAEVDNCFTGHSITFKRDGTFEASVANLVDNTALGSWAISEEHLFINEATYWKIKSFTGSTMRIETFYVEERGLTDDTTHTLIFNGPFVRDFKKK